VGPSSPGSRVCGHLPEFDLQPLQEITAKLRLVKFESLKGKRNIIGCQDPSGSGAVENLLLTPSLWASYFPIQGFHIAALLCSLAQRVSKQFHG